MSIRLLPHTTTHIQYAGCNPNTHAFCVHFRCGSAQCNDENHCSPVMGSATQGECCFPGDAAVAMLLPDGSVVTRRMDQLQIGDKV